MHEDEPQAEHAEATEETEAPLDDAAIRDLVVRLGRPHRSGGTVIERAALMAEAADFTAVVEWIEAHGGTPEAPIARRVSGGLHGARLGSAGHEPTPLRFILPAAALS